MNNEFSEDDLIALFESHRAAKKKKIKFFSPGKTLLSVLGLAIIFLVIINFPAIKSLFSFWFSTQVQTQSFENPKVEAVINKIAKLSSILPDVATNNIYIDKLNIKAPISFDVPNDANAVENGLEKGVIHIQGTAHPGEIGNVFITGHSSNYFWAKGSFNSIFALLNNLSLDDNIVINYRDSLYFYKVSDKLVVDPNDLSVLKQGSTSTLSLMTCYPVGTNLKRLIVIAKQVSPDPKLNKSISPSSLNYLPDIRR